MFLKTMDLPIENKIINNVFNWKNVLLRPLTLKLMISISFFSPYDSRQRRDLNSYLTTIYQALPLDCVSPTLLPIAVTWRERNKAPDSTSQPSLGLSFSSINGRGLKLSGRLHWKAGPQHYKNHSLESCYSEGSWDWQYGHYLEAC